MMTEPRGRQSEPLLAPPPSSPPHSEAEKHGALRAAPAGKRSPRHAPCISRCVPGHITPRVRSPVRPVGLPGRCALDATPSGPREQAACPALAAGNSGAGEAAVVRGGADRVLVCEPPPAGPVCGGQGFGHEPGTPRAPRRPPGTCRGPGRRLGPPAARLPSRPSKRQLQPPLSPCPPFRAGARLGSEVQTVEQSSGHPRLLAPPTAGEPRGLREECGGGGDTAVARRRWPSRPPPPGSPPRPPRRDPNRGLGAETASAQSPREGLMPGKAAAPRRPAATRREVACEPRVRKSFPREESGPVSLESPLAS